jgi:LPXTG-site transpeptidase (sortase) family protein
MKKITALFFVGLLTALVIFMFSANRTADASRAMAITSTPAEDTPTPLPTEFLTPTPLPPTETAVPTNTPQPTQPPRPGGGDVSEPTPTAVMVPALGMGEPANLTVDPGSPLTRIKIPALGLDSPIKRIHYNEGAWDVTDLGQAAGWLETSSQPALGGNTILVGHLDLVGNQMGAFAELGQLKIGAVIKIYSDETVYRYQVSQRLIVKADDTSVVADSLSPQLTLITCYGYSWSVVTKSYQQRLVLIATPVEN